MLMLLGEETSFPAAAQTAPSMAEFFKPTSTAQAGAITITAPAASSVTSTSVHLAASAEAPDPINFMRIYVDNVSRCSARASSVSTNLTMSAGKHNLVFQAWDSSGKVYRASKTITVP